MGRHKEKPLGHWYLWNRPDSSYWWVYRYERENSKKRIYRPTKKFKSDYTRSQMERILNTVQGVVRRKDRGYHSIEQIEYYILRKLRLEELSENSISIYKNSFNHLRKIYGGSYSVLNLRRNAIDDIKEYFISKGLDANVCLRTLRAAFQRLYDDEVIDKNPFVRFKPMKRKPKEKQHLTLTELREFLKFIKNKTSEDTWRIIRIYAGTGRRRNEILYLRHEHVDLEKGIYRPIDIKSRDKHRITRSIPDDVIDDFKYFIKKYPKSEYPFKICHEATITHRAIDLFREAGYSTLSLHSLRHSYITILEEKGFTDREIQLIIGHSDRVVTRRYSHKKIEDSPSIGVNI